MEIHARLNLPVLETGALVVAWTPAEEDKLGALIDRARVNGVAVEPFTARQMAAKQPHLSDKALAGLHIPGEFVVDPWTTPFAYLLQAIENGADVLRDTEVTGGNFNGDRWCLETSSRPPSETCTTVVLTWISTPAFLARLTRAAA